MPAKVSQMASLYNQRFDQLLLCKDEALTIAGMKPRFKKTMEDSKEEELRRQLLTVEEVAKDQRKLEQTKESQFLQKVEADFHRVFINEIEKQFTDTAQLNTKFFNFDPEVGKLLDVLYTRACSISRLVGHVEKIGWLETLVMRFVRQPKYHRSDTQGHAIVLKTLQGALRFIGIENLQILLPVLVAQHCMPKSTEAAPSLSKHLWLYTVGSANIAKALADSRDVLPHFAYNIGLLSVLGHIAVANTYLRAFDRELEAFIQRAEKTNNQAYLQVLASLRPSHKYIVALWNKHAMTINSEIFKSLRCRWLVIGSAFEESKRIHVVSYKHLQQQDMNEMTKLLFSSQGYMRFKMLQKYRLIDDKASALYLRNFGITAGDISILSKLKLTNIDIVIKEKNKVFS